MKILKKYYWAVIACLGISLVAMFTAVYLFISPAYTGEEVRSVYLRSGDNVTKELEEQAHVRTRGFGLLSTFLGYRVRPGRYDIQPGDRIIAIFRRLRNGQQTPVRLVLPSVRTMNDMADFLGEHLMMEAAAVADSLTDSTYLARWGYTPETIPALFVPNTYEVYWNTTLSDFLRRMQKENDHFWNSTRQAKATRMGFTPIEVATLASIVDEETANNAEKPMVAGMYIHRMEIGMPLQADPTVKFAVGDFSLRRILKQHLEVESPYNTYKEEGLPPGPIRVASVAGIDAVLNYVRHNYIYMCAKEDFSGTHNFAATYSEHLLNARRYQRALNQRGIK